MWKIIFDDARNFVRRSGRSGVTPWAKVILFTPGFHLVVSIRLQRGLEAIPIIGVMLRTIIWYFTTVVFSCDISVSASFGPKLYIPHPTGIVIGGEWDVGEDVAIMQNVTLGRRQPPQGRATVGNHVIIGAGAVILGEITLGDNCHVGANAVVLDNVPSFCVAVGVPAKIVSSKIPS